MVDTVVDVNKELGCSGEPNVLIRCSVVVDSKKAMGKEILDTLKSMKGNGALGSVWEIIGLDRVRDGDGVGHVVVLVFGDREREFAKGDGNRGFRSVWDVLLHIYGEESGKGQRRGMNR